MRTLRNEPISLLVTWTVTDRTEGPGRLEAFLCRRFREPAVESGGGHENPHDRRAGGRRGSVRPASAPAPRHVAPRQAGEALGQHRRTDRQRASGGLGPADAPAVAG